MKITPMLLTPNKFSRPGIRMNKVTGVAWHYIGNPGTSAQANRNYFENLKSQKGNTYVSSHYIIGLQGEIIQCIPETEWSYCTTVANGYTISIECCHPDSTGKFTAATEQALVELTADICKRHGLNPQTAIMRHYDVTKKRCPLYYVTHPEAYTAAKQRVFELVNGVKKSGWIEQAGRWWYSHADGSYPKNKWEEIKGKWYRFDGNGYMQTGWIQDTGKWYFCDESGAMKVNDWVHSNNEWYYVDGKGAMVTEWLEIGGRWYYFIPPKGNAARGKMTIKGKDYIFVEKAGNGLKECQMVDNND